jgi:hypothetical protein
MCDVFVVTFRVVARGHCEALCARVGVGFTFFLGSRCQIGVTGETGSDNHLLNCPHGLVIHKGTLYVADRDNHRIQAFDFETGAFKRTVFGTTASAYLAMSMGVRQGAQESGSTSRMCAIYDQSLHTLLFDC